VQFSANIYFKSPSVSAAYIKPTAIKISRKRQKPISPQKAEAISAQTRFPFTGSSQLHKIELEPHLAIHFFLRSHTLKFVAAHISSCWAKRIYRRPILGSDQLHLYAACETVSGLLVSPLCSSLGRVWFSAGPPLWIKQRALSSDPHPI